MQLFSHRTLALVFITVCSFQASAVTLVEDNRWVRTVNDDGSTVTTPPSAFADWFGNNQTSTLTSTRFVGLGSGSGESDFFFSITDSYFDVTFEVAIATLVDLQGALSGEDGDFGLGGANITLYMGSNSNGPVMFSASGRTSDPSW